MAHIERKPQGMMADSLAELRELIVDLADGEPCDFDHHGGCQSHGYIDLEPDQQCPQGKANRLAAKWAGE